MTGTLSPADAQRRPAARRDFEIAARFERARGREDASAEVRLAPPRRDRPVTAPPAA